MAKLKSTNACPWFPMSPRDWIEGTRYMSLEERGAYIDMICLQMLHEAPIREDYSWLAHQLHIHPRVANRVVSSIIEAMKFRRTSDGRLSNERCELEISHRNEVSEKAAENARKRWDGAVDASRKRAANGDLTAIDSANTREMNADNSPNQLPLDEKLSNRNNAPQMRPHHVRICGSDAINKDNDKGFDSPLVGTQSPSIDSEQVETMRSASRSAASGYSASFEAFWAYYPIKRGKAEAAKAWAKLKPDDRVHAMHGIANYVAHLRDNPDEPVKYAQGWLNGRRWEDQYGEPETQAAAPWWEDRDKVADITDERWRAGIKQYANGSWPTRKLGPAPGHMDCVVPRHIVDELELTSIYDTLGLRKD